MNKSYILEYLKVKKHEFKKIMVLPHLDCMVVMQEMK